MAVLDAAPDGDPDVEAECPNCGGTIAVFLDRVGEDGEEQCVRRATVHREPSED